MITYNFNFFSSTVQWYFQYLIVFIPRRSVAQLSPSGGHFRKQLHILHTGKMLITRTVARLDYRRWNVRFLGPRTHPDTVSTWCFIFLWLNSHLTWICAVLPVLELDRLGITHPHINSDVVEWQTHQRDIWLTDKTSGSRTMSVIYR